MKSVYSRLLKALIMKTVYSQTDVLIKNFSSTHSCFSNNIVSQDSRYFKF